jgi:hypothetical protein
VVRMVLMRPTAVADDQVNINKACANTTQKSAKSADLPSSSHLQCTYVPLSSPYHQSDVCLAKTLPTSLPDATLRRTRGPKNDAELHRAAVLNRTGAAASVRVTAPVRGQGAAGEGARGQAPERDVGYPPRHLQGPRQQEAQAPRAAAAGRCGCCTMACYVWHKSMAVAAVWLCERWIGLRCVGLRMHQRAGASPSRAGPVQST